MSVQKNDNIDLRSPKPVRNTEVVGLGLPVSEYATKEDVPLGYRHLYMKVTDAAGDEWRLEGGIADANWVKKTALTIPTDYVERFVATDGQTSHTVSEAAIENDGLWTVQVESYLLNSRTGITSFTDGSISIDFATGEITFHYPLALGDHVIIKYH